MYIRSSTISAIVALYAELVLGTDHLGEGGAASSPALQAAGVKGGQAAGLQGGQAVGAAPAAVTINPGPAPNGNQIGAQAGGVQAGGVQTGVGLAGQAEPVSGTTQVWVVKVGAAGARLVFEPNKLAARPGDMVQFQFNPKNHSVAMSNFEQPCVPIQQTNPSAPNAFWSGFMPTDRQGMITYTIPVPDTKAIWFYCAQGKHCQQGMVGVINEPQNSPNTLQAYAAKAAQAPENIAPNGAPSAGVGVVPGVPAPTGSNPIGGNSAGGIGNIPGGGVIAPSGTEILPAQATTNAASSTEIRSGLWGLLVAVLVWLF